MEPLYIKIDQNVEVDHQHIVLGDIAKLTSSDKKMVGRLKAMTIINVKEKKFGRYIVSLLAVIEKIHEVYPQLEIVNIGEADFVLTYQEPKKLNVALEGLKIVFICLASFFGAAFTIMTFNNDVGTADLFVHFYEEMTGESSNGFTILEITYSIGIAVGMIGFFNHFMGRKLTTDPTPLEVEMKIYENDINEMLIDSCSRKESMIDVD